MEEAARELLRAIRGSLSQVAFSRRLGYASNIAADWEAGRRFPTIAETLRAAEVRRIDVRGAFAAFHPRSADRFDPEDLAGWLDALRGSATNRQLAHRTGFSEHRVGRFLRGGSAPRLPHFLVLLEGITARCSDWVAALVPIAQVPSLAGVHEARTRVRRLVFERPWTAAILPMLGVLQPCPDPAGRIAGALGIDEPTVRTVLEILAGAGVIAERPEGTVVVAPLTVDSHPTSDDLRGLREHWARVSLERLGAPDPDDRFAHNVFNVSRADLERIRTLQAQTWREIRAIVAASEPSEVTALWVNHLLTWR